MPKQNEKDNIANYTGINYMIPDFRFLTSEIFCIHKYIASYDDWVTPPPES